MDRSWVCRFVMEATMPNKKNRTIDFLFNGYIDTQAQGLIALQKRLRKPWLWYGVGYTIVTPLGQKITGVFESQ